MRRLVLLLFALAFPVTALADTHYVSKTGSNTHPYTSWATATDSVLLAIEAASEGDTVRVGPGLFTSDSLALKDRMSFIGSGMDSTRILHNGRDHDLIVMGDSCLVQGFHLGGTASRTPGGVVTYNLPYGIHARERTDGLIAHNRITAARYCILIHGSWLGGLRYRVGVRVESNVIDTFEVGVMQWRTASDIRSNVIFASFDGWGAGIEHPYGANAVVESNVIIVSRGISNALHLDNCREIQVRNNVFMGVQDHYGLLVDVNSHHDSCQYGTTVGEITNNLFYGGRHGLAVYSCAYPVVRGNIFTKCDWWDMLLVSDDSTRVGHNLYWDTHGPNPPLDSAKRRSRQSIFADPMFVDSLDFHLQAFSPAIDAGDTLLFDRDGTRSDIGPYGGPLGQTYAYLDLPPRSPTGLTGEILSQNRVQLYWHRNHESDLHHYDVYWSPEAFVHPDPGGSTILVRSVAGDTSCIHTADFDDHPYCSWAVRAVDAQGNAGSFSESFAFAVAGIGDEDPTLPGQFSLHQNYPNPFNASTRITYSLAAPSEVTLAIYDVLGRHVRTLVREAQPAGEHRVRWDGEDRGGRDVASGVYLLQLSVGREAETRKVLLLK